MAYWALYYMDLRILRDSDVLPSREDTFAVCALPRWSQNTDDGQVYTVPPEEFGFFIRDERTMVEIISYNYREISEGEFDIFLAFECGPEAKSIYGDDDEHSRLYILK